jgi:hypothetical protein
MFETTYCLQILAGDEWQYYSAEEYDTAAEAHWQAAQMYGGLSPDRYRLVEVTRAVIEN